ncbi:MAG: hypothetical protein WBL63_09780 [Candidatus Acidiferrum sp.]
MRRETETLTLVDDLKQVASDRLDPKAMRDPGRGRPGTSVIVNSTLLPGTSSPERSLGDRIRGLLSKLDKALEGDHEFHNHLGM